jgi:hypothetical protein
MQLLGGQFEAVVCGDWLYNALSATDEKGMSKTSSIAIAFTNVMTKYPIEDSMAELFPVLSDVKKLFFGIRGLVDPTPGAIVGHQMSDIAFLSPFDSTDPCVSQSKLGSAGALSRLFKGNSTWRNLRAAYQPCAGAESSRGPDLKTLFDTFARLVESLAAEVPEDDIDAETHQNEEMDIAAKTLNGYVSRRPGDVEAFRAGALKAVDEMAIKVCTALWKLVTMYEEQSMDHVAAVRETAKALHCTALLQTVNESMMSKIGASATSRLVDAISKPADNMASLVSQYEAYRACANVVKSEQIIHDLQKLLPQIRRMITKVLDAPGATTATEDFHIPRKFENELSCDPSVMGTASLPVETANSKVFGKIVDAILFLKTSIATCSASFTDGAAQRAAFNKLARDATAVEASIRHQVFNRLPYCSSHPFVIVARVPSS